MDREGNTLRSFRDILRDELQDDDFRDEWESQAPARVVALRLVQYRAQHSLSQSALGRALGMSQPAVARLESGEHLPTLRTLLRISEALEIEILLDIRPETRRSIWVVKSAESKAAVAERVKLHTGQELLVAAS